MKMEQFHAKGSKLSNQETMNTHLRKLLGPGLLTSEEYILRHVSSHQRMRHVNTARDFPFPFLQTDPEQEWTQIVRALLLLVHIRNSIKPKHTWQTDEWFEHIGLKEALSSRNESIKSCLTKYMDDYLAWMLVKKGVDVVHKMVFATTNSVMNRYGTNPLPICTASMDDRRDTVEYMKATLYMCTARYKGTVMVEVYHSLDWLPRVGRMAREYDEAMNS